MNGRLLPMDPMRKRSLNDSYKVGEMVGSGTYGKVYQAASKKSDHHPMGVKQSKFLREDRYIPGPIFRELALLSEISHDNIIHISRDDVFCDHEERNLSFAYEFAACDVRKLVKYYGKKGQQIPQPVIKSLVYQLLLALDHLHKQSIIHCDITPSNIVVMPTSSSTPGVVKLIDFGLSRMVDNVSLERNYGVVTVWYRAPELLLGDRRYSSAIDLWATGCVFAELVCCSTLFAPQQKNHESDPLAFNSIQLDKIQEILGPIPRDYFPFHTNCVHFEKFRNRPPPIQKTTLDDVLRQLSPLGLDLIKKLLLYNPDERISAHDALRHEYFNENPIPAMNIARLVPPADWDQLRQLGLRAPVS